MICIRAPKSIAVHCASGEVAPECIGADCAPGRLSLGSTCPRRLARRASAVQVGPTTGPAPSASLALAGEKRLTFLAGAAG
jgi:hypothetical protein